jgi:hypothetical protein
VVSGKGENDNCDQNGIWMSGQLNVINRDFISGNPPHTKKSTTDYKNK